MPSDAEVRGWYFPTDYHTVVDAAKAFDGEAQKRPRTHGRVRRSPWWQVVVLSNRCLKPCVSWYRR